MINQGDIERSLSAIIKEKTREAREAIIKEAVEKFESDLRRNALAACEFVVDRFYSVSVDGSNIVITVKDVRGR